jgi:hypothetical protein
MTSPTTHRHLTVVPTGPEPGPPAPRASLGPCRDCGIYGPDVEAVPKVRLRREHATVLACTSHVTKYISRCLDLDWLARRRAAALGESVHEAKAALTSNHRESRNGSTT